jgi:hypothetical protein
MGRVTAIIRTLQAAQLQHDLMLLTLTGLGTLATALIVISYTAWRTQ